MVDREDLIGYITNNHPCEEIMCFDGGMCCKCAEKLLKEYENNIRADAIEKLLKNLCIGCAYLNGTKCENKCGCPCLVGQSEIIKSANEVLEQLKEKKNE